MVVWPVESTIHRSPWKRRKIEQYPRQLYFLIKTVVLVERRAGADHQSPLLFAQPNVRCLKVGVSEEWRLAFALSNRIVHNTWAELELGAWYGYMYRAVS
jgi:hypothetical protein